jgi:cobalt/nickel transport system ATP-binding protein
MNALAVRQLRYVYPDGTVALDGVDFELREGETVALFGANGSGKTTFVLCLAGLLKPASGFVTTSEIGLVFQDADDQLFMPTVLDDVMFGLLNRGMAAEEAERIALASLRRVGIDDGSRRPPYHLSAGEKRRVAIAGVLAMNPRVLVLDEPTTYLDPPGQRELMTILRSLPQAKIIVTHDTEFASASATRAVFFQKGRIVGDSSVAEIVEQFNWRTS